MTTRFLFIYGTLLQADNDFAIYLQNNSKQYANGKFKGLLYDVGEYPGAIETNNDNNYVYGCIVELKDIAVLKTIDHYEDHPNLFIRKLIEVEYDKRLITCWVYLYNLPVTGLQPIISGDYLSYKKA